MIKRYYKSCISLKYAAAETITAFVIFLFAFITFRTGSKLTYWLAMAAAAVLVILLIIVQIEKTKVSSQLKKVSKVSQYYDHGAMLGRSFFLEDRILICDPKMKIEEISPEGHQKMDVKEMPKEKYQVSLDDHIFIVDNDTQARRLAAFLKRKNPGLVITGIEPEGNGTLKELGAD